MPPTDERAPEARTTLAQEQLGRRMAEAPPHEWADLARKAGVHVPEGREQILVDRWIFEKATIRLAILAGRMRACPAHEAEGTHDLSLMEVESWVEEQRAALLDAERPDAPGGEQEPEWFDWREAASREELLADIAQRLVNAVEVRESLGALAPLAGEARQVLALRPAAPHGSSPMLTDPHGGE